MKTGLIHRAVSGLGLAAAALLFFASTAAAQTEVAINAIQGNGNLSALNGREVRTQGIVTAITRTGFFIQTPDDKVDSDTHTSEGIQVFTREAPPAAAVVGALVQVTGTVDEFRPRTETAALTVTQISVKDPGTGIRSISGGNALPKPVILSAADFESNKPDQLEKYEGMRVQVAAMSVVSPTGGRVDITRSSAESNGTFFGVLKGTARPFREPGLDILEYVMMDPKAQQQLRKDLPKLVLFDGNPERIRVESTAQIGAKPIDVASTQEIAGLAGVLHYSFRTYTILVDTDSKHKVTGRFAAAAIPILTPDQFSVAAMNIENFFDDEDDPSIKEDIVGKEAFELRLGKISAGIRADMLMPDVIGVAEAENLNVLKRLANRLNADAKASGKPDPKYDAFLIEGNDGRGIDNGFLVKTSRVKVIEVKQFGKADKYKHPVTGEEVFLNDRPPLLLSASIAGSKGAFEFTAIMNHMKSFSGYNDERQKSNVRMKKRLQAEYLAQLVQDRQKANPKERILVMGDLNMYQFNDGILDLVGTIIGKPAAKDAVFNSSPDLVDPDLIGLVDLIAARERYSYLFDGNAQVLDHIIVNQTFRPNVLGFGFVRINADQPEIMRNDGSRPERFSDHDPAIAYFSLN
jgi:uncharacterized protein